MKIMDKPVQLPKIPFQAHLFASYENISSVYLEPNLFLVQIRLQIIQLFL